MPELRTDPVSGHTVIVAPERMIRPGAFAASGWPDPEPPCPFCRGQEHETPTEVALFPVHATNSDWQIRVVPNKYPALSCGPNGTQRHHTEVPPQQDRLFVSRPAIGHHEVVIEAPSHLRSLTELSTNHIAMIFDAYVQRSQWMQNRAGIRYVSIFKNHGPSAGASLPHSHSQILGLDQVPPAITREIAACRTYAASHKGCLFCQIIEGELALGTRIVDETDDFVVLCPFASRLPYEWWILPKRHAARFDQSEQRERVALSKVLRDSLIRLGRLANHVPFNFYLHSAPFDMLTDEHYHWHIECLPRMARRAGFEWGTDIHINPVSPEQAASQLRSLHP